MNTSLCKVFSKDEALTIPDFPTLSISFHRTIDEVYSIWDSLQPGFLMSERFLGVVETVPPQGMTFLYSLVREDGRVKAIIPAQITLYEADKSLSNPLQEETKGWLDNLMQRIKQRLAGWIKLKTLVVGNLLLTGEHAVYGVPPAEHEQLLTWAVPRMLQHLKKQGQKISLVFVKDFFDQPGVKPMSPCCYFRFKAHPNMIMDLPTSWFTFDHYLQALSSKYRIRANRAIKKAAGLDCRPLSLQEVHSFKFSIYALYEQVVKNADFNLFHLHPDYFYTMYKNFPGQYFMHGFFIRDELVGFCSYFIHDHTLEAHFLGYDQRLNASVQLYLNMLFKLIEFALNHRVKRIIMGRTAMEIKSSVGALGFDMHCYLRHTNPFINALLPRIYRTLETDFSWKPRNPFKEN